MSFIGRSAGFPPAGTPAWPLCRPPAWRGGAAPAPTVPPGQYWWHTDAVFALAFPDLRFMRGGAELSADTLLSVTRSSPIILPDAAGIYQSLANDTLPGTDRGLYANGQSSRLNTGPNFNPSTASDFTSRNSAALDIVARGSWPAPVEAAFTASPLCNLAVTSALRVTCPGAAVNEGVTFPGQLPGNTNGIASAFVFVESGAKPLIGLSATAQVLSGAEVLDNFERTVNPVASSSNRVMAIATNHNVAAAASIFWVILQDLKAGTFATPPVAHPDTTLLASDIRAVQGSRPSNDQPEPFPGWEAAGLDAGFAILADFENRVRGVNSRRLFQLSGGTDVIVGTVPDGTSLRLEVGGVSSGTTAPGGQTGGRSRMCARIFPDGNVAIGQKGSGDLVTALRDPLTMTHSAFHIGNVSTLTAPWRDWIYELQICTPLSDAQLLEWVNA